MPLPRRLYQQLGPATLEAGRRGAHAADVGAWRHLAAAEAGVLQHVVLRDHAHREGADLVLDPRALDAVLVVCPRGTPPARAAVTGPVLLRDLPGPPTPSTA